MGLAAGAVLLTVVSAATVSSAALETHPAPPTCIPDDVVGTTFCLSSEERALGEVPVHSPTVPDSILIDFGISLTRAPQDSARATVTEREAEREALQNFSGGDAHSAVLAEWHSSTGEPARGPLVWVVDVSPAQAVLPPPGRTRYVIVLVAARWGASGYLPGFGYYTGIFETGVAGTPTLR